MNRSELIQLITEHIQSSLLESKVDVTAPQPPFASRRRNLGVVVGEIADLIRPNTTERKSDVDAVAKSRNKIIAVEDIAAFVDDEVQPSIEKEILAAVMVDNSVLAEIVAAIQSKMDETPHVSEALRSRMQATLTTRFSSSQTGSSLPEAKASPVAVAGPERDGTPLWTSQRNVLVILAAMAACVLFVIGARSWFGADPSEESEGLVRQRGAIADSQQETNTDALPNTSKLRTPTNADLEMQLAENAESERPESGNTADNSQSIREMEPFPGYERQLANDETRIEPSEAGSKNTAAPTLGGSESTRNVAENSTGEMPRSAADIQRATPSFRRFIVLDTDGIAVRPNGVSESVSRANLADFSVLQADSLVGSAKPAELVSLPFSKVTMREESDSENPFEIVLGPDSAMQMLTRSNGNLSIGLEYGVMAWTNVVDGMVCELTSNESAVFQIEIPDQDSASVFFAHTVDGIEIRTDATELTVNGRRIEAPKSRRQDLRVVVFDDGDAISENVPRSIPSWLNDRTSVIPRDVLAQVVASQSPLQTLDNLIADSVQNSRTPLDRQRLDVYAVWRSCLSDAAPIQQLGSMNEWTRLSAMRRLSFLAKWDPRYPGVWKAVSRNIGNEQLATTLQNCGEALRAGNALNPHQVTALTRILRQRNVLARSLADFYLRAQFGGGPQFDPNATGRELNTGLTRWEQFIRAQ